MMLRSSPLEKIPEELLALTMGFLDWHDILRIRRVSRKLRRISKERSVWLAVVQQAATAPYSDTIYLNKTLASHSAADLENAILAPRKADIGFNREESTYRISSLEPGDDLLKLLPGGRWALAWRDLTQEIVCYDMDSDPDSKGRLTSSVIFERPFESSGLKTSDGRPIPPPIDVDIDASSPYLSFRLAVYSRCGLEGEDVRSIQIWGVDARFDADGMVCGLGARLLCCFTPSKGCYGGELRLHGYYVSYLEESGEAYQCIVDWRLANGRVGNSPCRYLAIVSNPIAIVSNRYIVVMSQESIIDPYTAMIFDLTRLPETDAPDPKAKQGCIVWEQEVDRRYPRRYKCALEPIYTPECVRFVIPTFTDRCNQILGLSVPYTINKDQLPTMSPICTDTDYGFGERDRTASLYKSTTLLPVDFPDHDWELYTTRLLWDPARCPTLQSKMHSFPTNVDDGCHITTLLDGISSRVIIFVTGHALCVTYDFSV